MMAASRVLPPMPEIGRPESYYAKLAHRADKAGDTHAHEVAKVGQYVSLGLDPHLSWDEKLKYFRHALKRHCMPPPFPDDEIWMFYRQLADVVRRVAGQEALRIASTEDDMYAARISMGQAREKILDDADAFFSRLFATGGEQCPEWFNLEDWEQLILIRNQWV